MLVVIAAYNWPDAVNVRKYISQEGKPKRCENCALHLQLCVCSIIRPIETNTRISLIIHVKEWAKATNSGRHLDLALSNCRVNLRGVRGAALNASDLLSSEHENVVLYPSGKATQLDQYIKADNRPLNIIVPDGNWRQAKSMLKREAVLAQLPHVCLSSVEPSRYRLRSHPDPEKLCTYEAVSRSLEIVESVQTRKKLDYYFDVAVERALWTRGRINADEVTGGIPKGIKLQTARTISASEQE